MLPRTFTVGALAIAADGANAVGAVRLVCAEAGLRVELVHAAAFARGFVPGAVVRSERFTVPYAAVRGLVRRGRVLHLAMDPAAVAPHNRFALTRFTLDPEEALRVAYRAMLRARWASRALPLPLGLLTAALLPEHLAAGPIGRAAVALLIALLVWVPLREAAALAVSGGLESDRYRDAFERVLSRRLGIVPVPASSDPVLGEPAAPPRPREAGWGPALRIVAASAGLVAGLAGLRHVVAPAPPAPAPVTAADPALAAVARERARSTRPAAERPAPPCSCERADSVLWEQGIPVLSLLTESRPGGGPIPAMRGPGEGRRYDFDLVAVNNGERPLRDVRIVLTFARRDRRGERIGATDRGLFWGGELAPGQAVKWHVRAPGTEVRVDVNVTGMLGERGIAPARADAFAELSASARYRVARVHAAMMLAYLRDPRAGDAVRALDLVGPADQRAAQRILRAGSALFACDVRPAGMDRWDACVVNATFEDLGGITLREVTPSLPSPRAWPYEGLVPARSGVLLGLPLAGADEPPRELEVLAGP